MHHHARKQFGQHFLIDHQIIDDIITAIDPIADDNLIEIGPGLGALTQSILPHVTTLNVIEIDSDVIPLLKKKCANSAKLVIHQHDALRFDFSKFAKPKQPLRLFGNLPYNVGTELIFHFLDQLSLIKDMHFMLQKEVAERISATPGTKNYGRLSVMVQYYCQVELLFNVGNTAFDPPPKVESSVIRLIPFQHKPVQVENLVTFKAVVQDAFGQRRKTLRNSLKNLIASEELEKIDIDFNLRAEQLSIQDFAKISNYLSSE